MNKLLYDDDSSHVLENDTVTNCIPIPPNLHHICGVPMSTREIHIHIIS